MESDYRITITVDRDLAKRLDSKLPWGAKTQVIRKCIELLVNFIEKHGLVGAALILEDKVELKGVETRRPREDSRTNEPGGTPGASA